MYNKTGFKFLKDFLLVAPLSHALWRSVEALSFSQEKIKKPVLDLGCGFGEFAGVVYGKLECGVDINKSDLKIALSGKKYSKVIHADARNLPFRNGKFSTVISVSVMEHITDAPRVIKEVNRILKKHGTFIFSVPTVDLYNNLLIPKLLNKFGLTGISKFYISIHKLAFKHVTIRSAAWWEKHLVSSNFKVVKKHGTISKTLVVIHELFLLFALPSQVWRWITGKRLIILPIRAKILPIFFSRYVVSDKKSQTNMFIVAQKI